MQVMQESNTILINCDNLSKVQMNIFPITWSHHLGCYYPMDNAHGMTNRITCGKIVCLVTNYRGWD